jgi:signal transduction histidine kinase
MSEKGGRRKHSSTQRAARRAQLWVLGLLAVCAVQVLWWVFDHAVTTREAHDRVLAHHEASARIAGELEAVGIAPAALVELFDGIVPDGAGGYRVSPAIVDALDDERWHRFNRYAWEGGFFLLVIVVGMAVLGRAIAQEARLRRYQSELLSIVSHELKTPLAGMRLSLETLQLRDPEPERRKELLGRSHAALVRLERLVSNLLAAARLDRPHFELSREPIGLARMVEASCHELEETVRQAGVTLEVEVEAGLEIEGDPQALRSILDNLVANAVRASRGRPDARVEIAARRNEDHILLTVSDNGHGFAPADADRLFRKFEVGGQSTEDRAGGTGLGLHLVRRLAELGGGSCHGASEGIDRGATFTVTFPVPGEERT